MNGAHHKRARRRWDRVGCHELGHGEVTMAQLARDIAQGYRHFFNRRVMPQPRFNPTFTGNGKQSLGEVAAFYVAIDRPPRGLLLQLCQANDLVYASLATRIYQLRKARREAA